MQTALQGTLNSLLGCSSTCSYKEAKCLRNLREAGCKLQGKAGASRIGHIRRNCPARATSCAGWKYRVQVKFGKTDDFHWQRNRWQRTSTTHSCPSSSCVKTHLWGLMIHAGLEGISARHRSAQPGSSAHPAYPFPGRKQTDHQAQTLGQRWDLVPSAPSQHPPHSAQ